MYYINKTGMKIELVKKKTLDPDVSLLWSIIGATKHVSMHPRGKWGLWNFEFLVDSAVAVTGKSKDKKTKENG